MKRAWPMVGLFYDWQPTHDDYSEDADADSVRRDWDDVVVSGVRFESTPPVELEP